jgi:hypothetical protein
MVVVAIMLLLGTIGIVNYVSFRSQSELSVWANNIVETVSLAKNKTLQAEYGEQHGVHFETDKFVLFRGIAYVAASTSNVIYALPGSLEIASISLNAATSDVVFKKVTGQTDNYGAIVLRQKAGNNNSIEIHVDRSGSAGVDIAPLASTSTRIEDSRHVHVAFGQNIQSATSLLLEFPGYATNNVTVGFQTYLNPGKTVFSWEDNAILVGGATQSIKIHTHLIDLTGAEFSIHRDGRYNSRAVNIYINNPGAQQLIQYSAAGAVTNGTSPYAGDPEYQ